MTTPLDPTKQFSATVRDYARHRPNYPVEVLDWAEERLGRPPVVVADLAAGTGILTGLARTRWPVIGVEPNPDMLAAAATEHPGRWVRARAEAMGLRGGSVDLVLCGQAFHWFDREAARYELDRVIAPDGLLVAVWNLRDTSAGFGVDYEALLLRHSRTYKGKEAGVAFFDELREEVERSGGGERWIDHDQELDLASLQGRARSASYVAHGVTDLTSFEAELAELFARHAEDGVLRFPYQTLALAWRPR